MKLKTADEILKYCESWLRIAEARRDKYASQKEFDRALEEAIKASTLSKIILNIEICDKKEGKDDESN